MSYQIELRYLNYFLAVAEELHFRKAADKLFISQPGLSRQIKQLEAILKVKLFERNNRNVRLTPAGVYLQTELTKNLKELDGILNNAKKIYEGFEGNLKFGFVGSAMEKIIPDILVEMKNSYPNIHFSLEEMDNQQQIEQLESQNIDVGFVRLENVPNNLNLHPVFKDTFSLVMPKYYLQDFDKTKDFTLLKDESFIMFDPSYSPNYHRKIMEIFNHYKFSPKISHLSVHATSIYKLIELNFGISIVPTALKNSANDNVRFIELDEMPQRTILSGVWHKKNKNPIMDKFLEIILK